MPKLAAWLLALGALGACQRVPNAPAGTIGTSPPGPLGPPAPTGGPAAPASAPSAAAAEAEALRTQTLAQLRRHPAWQRVREAWQGVGRTSVSDLARLDPFVEQSKSANRAPLDELVAARLVSREAADALNEIYGERIYHHLRPMLATCYRPTLLGGRTARTREDLEQRLRVLGDLVRQGKVDAEVGRAAESAIAREMEVLLRAEELWAKRRASDGQNVEQLRQQEQQLLGLFLDQAAPTADIREELAPRPGVAQAMALIEALYAD